MAEGGGVILFALLWRIPCENRYVTRPLPLFYILHTNHWSQYITNLILQLSLKNILKCLLCRSMVLSPIISHQFFVRMCIISSCFKDSLTYSYFCKVKFQFFLKVFRKLRDVSDFILPEKTRFSGVVRGIKWEHWSEMGLCSKCKAYNCCIVNLYNVN